MRIKRINKCGKAPVYNMYVENVHCFAITKSNIISHNCDAMRYACKYYHNKTKGVSSYNLGW